MIFHMMEANLAHLYFLESRPSMVEACVMYNHDHDSFLWMHGLIWSDGIL